MRGQGQRVIASGGLSEARRGALGRDREREQRQAEKRLLPQRRALERGGFVSEPGVGLGGEVGTYAIRQSDPSRKGNGGDLLPAFPYI